MLYKLFFFFLFFPFQISSFFPFQISFFFPFLPFKYPFLFSLFPFIYFFFFFFPFKFLFLFSLFPLQISLFSLFIFVSFQHLFFVFIFFFSLQITFLFLFLYFTTYIFYFSFFVTITSTQMSSISTIHTKICFLYDKRQYCMHQLSPLFAFVKPLYISYNLFTSWTTCYSQMYIKGLDAKWFYLHFLYYAFKTFFRLHLRYRLKRIVM